MNPFPGERQDQAKRRGCLVLIPGSLCDARLFKHQLRVPRRDRHVIVLDYHELKDLEAWPAQVLRALPAKFCIGGFSLGGLWALELPRRAPERVQGRALMASNAEAGSRRSQRRSASLWRQWRLAGPDSVARRVKPDDFRPRAMRGRHTRPVRDLARGTRARAARAESQWAACHPSGLDLLPIFTKPMLTVSGARDRLCPRSLQQRMVQAQPRVHWVELPRCGHFIALERPRALTNHLSRWLKRMDHEPTPGNSE